MPQAQPDKTSNLNWNILFLCWLLASVSTTGSLFFSYVMQFAPCVLCWYQRIFLFPLVIILATGLFPRIRLPLPHCVTHNFRNFIEKRIAIGNDRYCYISLDQTKQPRYGNKEQIKAVILLNLDMQSSTQKVEDVKKKDVVKEIILRNFARQNKAIDIVDRIYSIVEDSDCYRLTYSDPNEAAKLLKDTFS